MADIGKNGYEWSGYTEPFIAPVQITGSTVLNLVDAGMGAGVIPIENTEFRNAGLYLRIKTGAAGATSFIATDINFDTIKDALNDGVFVIEDDLNAFVTVDLVSQRVVAGSPPKLEWDITTATATLTTGTAYKVVGRIPDTGTVAASKLYEIGDKVLEIYPFEA